MSDAIRGFTPFKPQVPASQLAVEGLRAPDQTDLARSDRDSDGLVNKDSFRPGRASGRQQSTLKLDEDPFARFDEVKDGKISGKKGRKLKRALRTLQESMGIPTKSYKVLGASKEDLVASLLHRRSEGGGMRRALRALAAENRELKAMLTSRTQEPTPAPVSEPEPATALSGKQQALEDYITKRQAIYDGLKALPADSLSESEAAMLKDFEAKLKLAGKIDAKPNIPAAKPSTPNGGLYLDMTPPETRWTSRVETYDFGGKPATRTTYTVDSDNRPPELLKTLADYRNAVLLTGKKSSALEPYIFANLANANAGQQPVMLLNMPKQVLPVMSQAYLGRPATPEEQAHYTEIGQHAAVTEIIKKGQEAYLSQFPDMAPSEVPGKIDSYMKYVKSLLYWTPADATFAID